MTTEEKLDQLADIVNKLAGAVTSHDSVIKTLAGAVTAHDSVIGTLANTVTAHKSVVETLAGAVTAHDSVIEAHDRQLGVLIEIATRHSKELEEDRARMRDLERQWQAYLNTLRRN